ncbi:unnamed protein product [Sphagnum balticum]
MPPHSILFTENSSKGAWVLKANSIAADHWMVIQLRSLGDGAKGSWIKEHGGNFDAGSGAIAAIIHDM